MKKCFFWVLVLIATSLVVISCGSDNEENKEIIIDQEIDYDKISKYDDEFVKYFDKYSYQLGIEDLWMEKTEIDDWAYTGNLIVFSGFKDERVWVSVFDTINKNKKIEYLDKNAFDRKITIYQGYGEYKDYEIESIKAHVLPLQKGFVLYIEKFYSGAHFYDVIYDGEIIISNYKRYVEYPPIPWYDNTFCFDGCVYNTRGDVLLEYGVSFNPRGSIFIPVSETDFISWGYSTRDVNGRIFRASLGWEGYLRMEKWQYTPKFLQSNDRVTITLSNMEGEIFTFIYDIVHYDGTKQKYQVKININGEGLNDVVPIEL